MNITLLSTAIAAAIGFGAAWRIQGSTITEMRLQDATRIATESHEAFKRLEKDATQVVVAQNNKVVRDAGLRADAGAATAAGNGLRLASSDAMRAAQASAATCLASVAKYDELLSAVVAAGGRMASEADGWESDAVMLNDSLATD